MEVKHAGSKRSHHEDDVGEVKSNKKVQVDVDRRGWSHHVVQYMATFMDPCTRIIFCRTLSKKLRRSTGQPEDVSRAAAERRMKEASERRANFLKQEPGEYKHSLDPGANLVESTGEDSWKLTEEGKRVQEMVSTQFGAKAWRWREETDLRTEFQLYCEWDAFQRRQAWKASAGFRVLTRHLAHDTASAGLKVVGRNPADHRMFADGAVAIHQFALLQELHVLLMARFATLVTRSETTDLHLPRLFTRAVEKALPAGQVLWEDLYRIFHDMTCSKCSVGQVYNCKTNFEPVRCVGCRKKICLNCVEIHHFKCRAHLAVECCIDCLPREKRDTRQCHSCDRNAAYCGERFLLEQHE